ncbi:DNA-binding response regulator [Azorhizobium oxalatiphilum]|uniref:DNA-binding response regulator n=1 Tax=Azorhizobium oxalatiphilum TaxID=980631 RepID=A0A917BLU3_9HYPH|nr:response regulator transcription factor [Azorhizobium oxalatiphilum]GGF50830.1 DNA-binding response regulator [Azorhizobium oxalatiphilum]
MRILVVEDDDRTAQHLVRGLSESGHVVNRAADGALGLAMALEDIYDIAVVDRMLPELDGLTLVRRLRDEDRHLPVLILSAIASAQDRSEGLRAGSDDYLAKPFHFSELLARLEALARRTDRARAQAVLRVADLSLDLRSRRGVRGARDIGLQPREFLLLETLMRNAHQVVSRSMLLEAAWDYDFEPKGNIIDMHIHRLRRKVEVAAERPLIHTIAGVGYMLSDRP